MPKTCIHTYSSHTPPPCKAATHVCGLAAAAPNPSNSAASSNVTYSRTQATSHTSVTGMAAVRPSQHDKYYRTTTEPIRSSNRTSAKHVANAAAPRANTVSILTAPIHTPLIFLTETHLSTHTQEKRYACPHPGCSFRCADASNLSKHKKTHQGPRYGCLHAGCTFQPANRWDNAKRHFKESGHCPELLIQGGEEQRAYKARAEEEAMVKMEGMKGVRF